MYITKVEIKGLKWLDVVGDIRSIQIEAMSQVQIVIGTNGSGKSKLIAQITPLPATKSDYHTGGYKKLTILHDGEEYVITSSFEKKQGKHSFCKNGAELNVNGLTNTQIDLCAQHLGYTQLIDDLTHCRYQITNMSVADRKQLLLSMSPSVPDFVIQLHKQAKSELRSCKSNLQLLYTRKQAVEEKLLSKEVITEMFNKSMLLSQQQLDLGNEIFLLNSRIKEYQAEKLTIEHEEVTVEKAVKYRKRVQHVFATAPMKFEVERFEEQMSALIAQRSQAEEQLRNARESFDKIQSELQQYDPTMFTTQDNEQRDCIDLISAKLKRLDEIKEFFQFPVISELQLPRHQQVQERLYDLFTGEQAQLHRVWYPTDRCNRVNYKCNVLQNRLQHHKERIRMADEQLVQIEEELKQLLNGPSEQLSNCKTCDYAIHFGSQRKKLEIKASSLKLEIEQQTKQLQKVERVLNRMLDLLDRLKQQLSTIEQVFQLLSGTVWQYTERDLLKILNGDLNYWLHQCHMTIQAQQFIREKAELEKEIQQAQLTIDALKKVQTPAMEILKKLYQEKLEQLQKCQLDAIRLHDLCQSINEKILFGERYKKLYEAGERLLKNVSSHHQYTMLDEYLRYLQTCVLPAFNTQKQELDNQIYSLTNQLKEQETLKARYTEEITTLIETIEKRQKVYNYLEIGLNPESGMPHHHTLQFINAILENVNFILSKIWTYPIQLELLKESDDVSCDFMARCNNKQPGPISRLSKSQQAAINFAFYPALVFAANGNDFPMFFDECDDGFDPRHKQTLLEWLNGYMDSQYAPQLWMIYHDPTLYSGFLYKDVVCLKKDNIQLPQEINLYTKINEL